MSKKQASSPIRILRSSAEAIRLRSSMYLGNMENVRNELLLELLCLPLAEAHCGTCTSIEIVLSTRGAVVEYDGLGPALVRTRRGTPSAEEIFTQMYACRDHKAHAELGSKLCGVGIVVVNALSEWFIAEISSDGLLHRQSYRDGQPEGPFQVIGETTSPGVKIRFLLAEEFAGSEPFEEQALIERIYKTDIDLSKVRLDIRHYRG